jgi:hypothetical protein
VCAICAPRIIEECTKCPICRQKGWHSKFKNKIVPVNNLQQIKKTSIDWLIVLTIITLYIIISGLLGYVTMLIFFRDMSQLTVSTILMLALVIGIGETLIICIVYHNSK